MNIGQYELHSIETGRFALDGGTMFGIVPKGIWSKLHPADDKNRIEMALRSLLIMDDKRKILVDTGIGTKLSKKDQKRSFILGTNERKQGLLKYHCFFLEESKKAPNQILVLGLFLF